MDNNVLKALNVIEQVNNVILGKDKQIREIMAAFLAGGSPVINKCFLWDILKKVITARASK